MSFLNKLTNTIAAPAKFILGSRPVQALAGSKVMRAIGMAGKNKYVAPLLGLGIAGSGVYAALTALNPLLGLSGILGGAFAANRASNPVVPEKNYKALEEAALKLKRQNVKLKLLGIPALGVGGLLAGYNAGKDDKQN